MRTLGEIEVEIDEFFEDSGIIWLGLAALLKADKAPPFFLLFLLGGLELCIGIPSPLSRKKCFIIICEEGCDFVMVVVLLFLVEMETIFFSAPTPALLLRVGVVMAVDVVCDGFLITMVCLEIF